MIGVLFTRNFLETGKKIQHLLEPDYGAGDPTFVRSMSQLLGPPLLEGNHIRLLNNGVQIFPAMLSAIHSAQRTITMENFVWTEGEVAWNFAHALAERARAGVKVHFLQDALGCGSLHTGSMAFLKNSPVEVEIFRFLQLTRMNFRTHRKLLTIDGKISFIGGVAISDAWNGNADQPDHWRDTHYHVEGPVVGQVQQAFTENWMQTRAVLLHGDDYFPELPAAGDDVCQVFKSQASEGSDGARVMLLLSLAAARKSIRIANAYFIPDKLTIRTLLAARRRGVTVEIICPSEYTDQPTVRKVSRGRWGHLLEAGVRFFEFQPARFHCKYMIVDDCWLSVGSANFDNRSLRLNDEANLNILDREFAAEHARVFDADKKLSREITMAEWQTRPMAEKILARAAGVFRAQL